MIRIRRAKTVDDYRQIELLQKAVWQFEDREIIPRNELITIQRSGGIVLAAFEKDRMVGFVFGFVGLEGRRLTHSSRMLAVLEDRRNTGIGRRLKEAQRQAALKQGIRTMTWTFDPLQSRNAHFNISVLGGTARDYYVDLYGPSTSILNRGVPTDRLLLRWDLKRPRGRKYSLEESRGRRTVEIPVDVNALRSRDEGRVLAERLRVRREFLQAFRDKWEVTGFASDGKSESRYVLTRGAKQETSR